MGIFFSEWVADGEVEGVKVTEALDIEEIARYAIVAGDMDGKAPVDTHYKESKVVTQAQSCTQGDVVEEARGLEVHVVEPIFHGFGKLFL